PDVAVVRAGRYRRVDAAGAGRGVRAGAACLARIAGGGNAERVMRPGIGNRESKKQKVRRHSGAAAASSRQNPESILTCSELTRSESKVDSGFPRSQSAAIRGRFPSRRNDVRKNIPWNG